MDAFIQSVLKPLPRALIDRLKRAAPRLEAALHRMENVDHRAQFSLSDNRRADSLAVGVRALNVKGAELVLKRAHGGSSQSVIDGVRKMVRFHNAFPESDYDLVEPHAYAISESLIAMSRADFPSIAEMFFEGTERGLVKAAELGPKGFDRMKVMAVLKRINEKIIQGEHEGKKFIDAKDILVVGAKNGKLQLVPLMDLY